MARWLFPSRGAERTPDPPALRPAAEGIGARRRARPGAAVAACAAPCLCQPSARSRRRSAQRAADARPCRYRDDADLYPRPGRAAAPAGRERASAGAAEMTAVARATALTRRGVTPRLPPADAPFSRFRTADRRARRQDRRTAPPVCRQRAQHRRRGRPARGPGDPAVAPELCAAEFVAEGAGGAPPGAAALPRLYRRADQRVRAARRRPRLCRGPGDRRRHRPVSRPQRDGPRHRKGRRHREPGHAQFRDGAARGVSEGAPPDAARRALPACRC